MPGVLEQRPARALELRGRVAVQAAQLVPGGAAHLVEGLGRERDDVERIEADQRLRRVTSGAHALLVPRAHVHRDRRELRRALGPELIEEGIRRAGVAALGAPNELAAAVVGDQAEITVVFAPRDLVEPDLEEPIQPAGVELRGADPLADRADRDPRDAHQARHRGRVHLRRQPGHERLEVGGEARARPREGHRPVGTPCVGQRRRRRRARTSSSKLPRSRWRQTESTCRRSYRKRVVTSHSGQRNRRRRSATSTMTRRCSNLTARTWTPGRRRRCLNTVVTRMGVRRSPAC